MNYFNISEKKIEVIPNGIDKSVFHMINKDEKESVKQSFGFARDEIIILYSGRLDKGKGIYSLINAFNLVCKQCNNIRLVLAGEDSGANRISQYLGHCTNIWGKVTFTGFVEYEIINKLYQIADIGIIPSLYDHCPYVALEMIGYNVPLIISNTEGLNEILTKDQCILITPIVDNDGNITLEENDIADAILSFTRNESSITNYIISDYQDLMKTKFSSKRMGKEMYSLLLNLQTTEVQTCFS